jgi:hypothetical protein
MTSALTVIIILLISWLISGLTGDALAAREGLLLRLRSLNGSALGQPPCNQTVISFIFGAHPTISTSGGTNI